MPVNYNIFQDFRANSKNVKGQFVLVLYRLAVWVRSNKLITILFFWYLIIYIFVVEWFMAIELSWHVRPGENLQLHHGFSLVVNPGVKIGKNCILRHCTTLGNKKSAEGDYNSGCPVIGDNVDIGANVCVIGPITIGNNVMIGAGSIVVKDVPSNCVIAGNPAKVLKYL
ncbi:putative colanic acid biosynthesis acetyltransferase WcaB [Mucilaginibacter sp. UYP25]|uniref:serine acetyltransferase n=1 Tax=unclassified Mucilaginibacter TaxID=2617802 RepID=UPI003397DA43